MATVNISLVGVQYNLSGAGDPYTVVFPSGENKAFPTGVRNISANPLTVTMQAADGFWNSETQSTDAQIERTLHENRSDMYVFFPGKGWVSYKVDSFVDTLLLQSIKAGYGGGIEETPTPLNIPTLAHVTLPFTDIFPSSPLAPLGCEFFPINNNFRVDHHGIWQLLVTFNLGDHDASQQGRTFEIRLYDETKSLPLPGLNVGIGRNQSDTLISIASLVQVNVADAGDLFRVEVGGGDAVSGGDATVDIFLSHVSEHGAYF